MAERDDWPETFAVASVGDEKWLELHGRILSLEEMTCHLAAWDAAMGRSDSEHR